MDKYETEDGFVLVANEMELDEWVKEAGWSNIEEFEKQHRVSRDELYGRKFDVVRGSLSFAE